MCRGLHSQRFEPGFGEEPQAAASSLYVRPSYGSEVGAAPVLLLWRCRPALLLLPSMPAGIRCLVC